jgi:hypothetical protein
VTLAAGCADGSRTTAPNPNAVSVPCGDSSVITLAPLQAAVIDCSAGDVVRLAGQGASYLVVPELATGDVADNSVPFALASSVRPSAGVVGDLAPAFQALATATGERWRSAGGRLQASFDAARLTADRAAVISGRWRPGTVQPGLEAAVQPAAAPVLNSVRSFRVLATADSTQNTYKTVAARLVYVGQNLLLYEDTLTTPALTSDVVQGIGGLFDQTLYPIDLANFGEPTDIDNNGAVVMLMSPVVNALTLASQCASQGYIIGFFNGLDLGAPSDANSNAGEVIYTIVPDAAGKFSCAHDLSEFLFAVPPTFLHEVQHLISFSQHVLVHGGYPEEGWLDEGMSLVAQELGSLYYEQKFPPPSGRTNPGQLFPDSSQGFIDDLLLDSYGYLLDPSSQSITLHSDADNGLAWRGGDWLLLRWLGDQFGSAVYSRLEHGLFTGTANIESATNVPFFSLFGDFGLALYADSIPGYPHDAAPLRDRFTSRNLRQLYQDVYNVLAPDPSVPQPFPITVTRLSSGGTASGSFVPGTVVYYELDSPADSATVSLRFASSSGTLLPATLQPQVAVIRLPN